MSRFRFALFLTVSLIALPAAAQTLSPPPATAPGVAGSAVPGAQKPADWDARLAIAKKLHTLRPIDQQMNSIVDRLSLRVPAQSRGEFKQKVLAAIDQKRLEDVSINAMAQTFTVDEMTKMYDYFTSPEAHSIAEKMPIYQQLVSPEIIKMLDKAMLDAKVGPAAAPSSPFQTQQSAPSGGIPMGGGMSLPHSAAPAGR